MVLPSESTVRALHLDARGRWLRNWEKRTTTMCEVLIDSGMDDDAWARATSLGGVEIRLGASQADVPSAVMMTENRSAGGYDTLQSGRWQRTRTT